MWIVFAVSRVTSIHTYYTGYVQQINAGRYSIENKWSAERRFATLFRTEELAQKVADTFKSENELIDFLVLEERDTR